MGDSLFGTGRNQVCHERNKEKEKDDGGWNENDNVLYHHSESGDQTDHYDAGGEEPPEFVGIPVHLGAESLGQSRIQVDQTVEEYDVTMLFPKFGKGLHSLIWV